MQCVISISTNTTGGKQHGNCSLVIEVEYGLKLLTMGSLVQSQVASQSHLIVCVTVFMACDKTIHACTHTYTHDFAHLVTSG